jgi:ABC-type cobalamin/Fe3+-siderophores transport system ATPase subunit/rubrerythrin
MSLDETDGIYSGAKIRLPRPLRVTLRNFSLYKNLPAITADFGTGVFCLAGANGLGKSTFLAALNFAITGIVADPDRKFDSVEEYYRYSRPYSAEFFRGRISEIDRDSAEIELEMMVGGRHYRLVRSMFEPDGLREFTVTPAQSFDSDRDLNAVTVNNKERHAAYANSVTRDAGLERFEQLVFLQHFVLTFDERRRLLFWDETVAQTAMFMAFGLSLEDAEKADNLRRTAERADSLVRNLQWQATETRKRLRDLEAKATQAATEQVADIADEHRRLLDLQAESSSHTDRLEADVRDAELRLAENRARRDAARREYEMLFSERHSGRTWPAAHPVVARSIETSECAICGTHSAHVASTIQSKISAGNCPLCGTDLSLNVHEERDHDRLDYLQSLDAKIAQYDSAIKDAELAIERIGNSFLESRSALIKVSDLLAAFERENEMALVGDRGESSAVRGIADQYRQQIADLNARKQKELDRRTAARRELKVLQTELAEAYAQVRDEFVPRFSSLANEFLGLDLDVTFEVVSSKVLLVLTVQDTRRRAYDTLSESQRFFIDIALRMALAQQMSEPGSAAVLYIDTPEGSLDIAYESRAGSMFGNFVRDGHQIIMTANINTSQLLRKLATTCGPSLMKLLRMTEWTSLSEVQISEETMFDDAYEAIEDALAAGG